MMEKSAGIVIFRKTEKPLFLLLHYEGGHWDFPKGHLEKEESEKQAAIREAFEETGISQLDFIQGFEERISYFYTRDGKKIRKEVIYFAASTNTEKVIISDEHVGYEWLDSQEAMKKITFANSKQVLKKALNFLKK